MILMFLYPTVLIIAVYCIVVYLRNQSDQRQLNVMRQISQNLDLNPENTRIFNRMLLTLDKQDNTLLYISNYDGIEYKTINLDRVTACQLILKKLSVQVEFIYPEAYRPSDTIVFFQKYIHRSSHRSALIEEAKKLRNEIQRILEEPGRGDAVNKAGHPAQPYCSV